MLNKNSIILTSSIFLNVVLIGAVGYPYVAKKISNRLDKATYYDVKRTVFKAMPAAEKSIIFAGDSITDFAEWGEIFPGMLVKNRGINGDSTSGLLRRIDDIIAEKPAKVFLMIGINNIQSGISLDVTKSDFSEIFNKLGGSQVFVEYVLPINEQKYDDVIVRRLPGVHKPTRHDVDAINATIDAVAATNKNVKVIDTTHLTENGQLRPELTDDGLHLNGRGIIERAKNIRPFMD